MTLHQRFAQVRAAAGVSSHSFLLAPERNRGLMHSLSPNKPWKVFFRLAQKVNPRVRGALDLTAPIRPTVPKSVSWFICVALHPHASAESGEDPEKKNRADLNEAARLSPFRSRDNLEARDGALFEPVLCRRHSSFSLSLTTWNPSVFPPDLVM